MTQKRPQQKPSAPTNTHPILGASKSGLIASSEGQLGRNPTMISRFTRDLLITRAGGPKGIGVEVILPTFKQPVRAMGVYPTISATNTKVTLGCPLPLLSNSPRHRPNTARLFPERWISRSSRHTDTNLPNLTPTTLPRRLLPCTKGPTRTSGTSQCRVETIPLL